MLPIWLLLACSAPPPPGLAVGTGPSVLLITVDSLRGDRLGFAGHPGAHTPHLDALAARGRVFTHAITPMPAGTPAVASLHTGLAPHHHGSRADGEPVRAGTPLARRLRRGGWQTVAVVADPAVGRAAGLQAGFDRFRTDPDAPARWLTHQALEDAARAQPGALLLWVHYAQPRFPYDPPTTAPLLPEAAACRGLGAGRRERRRAEAARADCSLLYDADVAALDAALGALLEGWAALRPDGRVVVTSAHGEHFGEAGLYFDHGPSLHVAALEVPLVLAGPGAKPGSDARLVSLLDVLPTMLTWLGEPVPAGLDGHAQPLDGSGAARPAFAEAAPAATLDLFGFLVSGAGPRRCLNGPRYSLCSGSGGPPTLHDHEADPSLALDLSTTLPAVYGALVEALGQWPADRARARMVRDGPSKLVATPRVEGGYDYVLYDLAISAGGQVEVTADRPAEAARLRALLHGWSGWPAD